jgi:lantibiotic modifying enzyme
MEVDFPALAAMRQLIVGLCQTDPEQRWSLKQAEEFLTEPERLTGGSAVAHDAILLRQSVLDQLIADSVTHLQRGMLPDGSTLWPRGKLGGDFDVCQLWRGAAGGLATLTRAAQVLDNSSLPEMVAEAADWIDKRLFAVPRLLPGLCFGRAGTAWALFDAAQLLGDGKLASRAIELAGKLPTQGPIPDVTHGLAGAGLARLYLWQATGDRDLLQQALGCADSVLAAANRQGEEWLWSASPTADSEIVGTISYGFAHGVAGVGAFLLAAAQAVAGHRSGSASSLQAEHDRYLEAALGAGDTLARAARVQGQALSWPLAVGVSGFTPTGMSWCRGPVGIGTFLIRLWSATGEQRFADLAVRCAPTDQSRWSTAVGACCGLAGSGHFLLDLADLTGQHHFRAQAEAIAVVIHAQRHMSGDLQIPCPADNGYTYAEGAAGVLDFLLRLRHGGSHPWLPNIQTSTCGAPARP